MRRAKSLVCAALFRSDVAALAWACTAASVLLPASIGWAEAASNHVRDVRVHADDAVPGGTRIEVVGTVAPIYNVRVAEGGRRLFVDVSDADVAGAPAAITQGVGVVGGILTQAYPTATGFMTRLTVSLQREATYRVVADGTTLNVIIAPKATADAPGGAVASPSKASTVSVRDVRFER